MNFLPVEHIEIKTRLKPTEVLQRLIKITEPKKIIRSTYFGPKTDKQYEGEIRDNGFTVTRIIGYRNSFLPRIKGTIEADLGSTCIKIKMNLPVFVAIFIGFWCLAVGFACIIVLTRSIQLGVFHAYGLIPFAMLLFAYGLTMGAFMYETKRSKNDFKQLWEAFEV